MGMSVYHQIKIVLSTFAGKEFLESCGIEMTPIAMFIVMGILHHPLALSMIVPMNIYYYDLVEYCPVCERFLDARRGQKLGTTSLRSRCWAPRPSAFT